MHFFTPSMTHTTKKNACVKKKMTETKSTKNDHRFVFRIEFSTCQDLSFKQGLTQS